MLGPRTARSAALLLAPALLLALATCEDAKSPTEVTPDRPAAALATTQSGVTAQGTIPLPINQSIASSGIAFGITQTGTGQSGVFKIANSANTATALFAQSNGSGKSLYVKATGTGTAGTFENSNAGSGSNTLYAISAGSGNTISSVNTGAGVAGSFVKTSSTSSSAALYAQTAGSGSAVRAVTSGTGNSGYFEKGSGTQGGAALFARNAGISLAANFVINNSNNLADAMFVYTNGGGWAGHFQGSGSAAKGVLIETGGGAGLQVIGGTKNAVVKTTSGSRALYTEEATEVWFADYGFGKLEHGRARILLDPTFAETINPDEPYHVFVQPYGDAELYVRDRTSLGFVVMARAGSDQEAEFSYRIVARRRGFEHERLAPAPWADAPRIDPRDR
ncbi:MAG TPA: hypothetical protein VFS05_14220 [Gemmatimonadaceae bacterium]|nr:hypothetical protein [Gemmatimonadaceae bacterium]